MLSKINLRQSFDYIWKSPFRNEILIKWGVIGILYMLSTFVLQFGVNILTYIGGGSETAVGIAGITVILLIYAIIFLMSIFAYGAGVNNYIKMARSFKTGNRDVVAQDSNLDVKLSLVNGLKIFAVMLYYSIPYLIVCIAFIIGGVFLNSASNQISESATPIFIIGLMIFVIFALVYALFLNIGVYPITLKLAEEEGFRSALNVSRVMQIFKNNFKDYLAYLLASFVIGICAILLWLGAIVSIVVCIGLILIPMSYGWMFMIQAYFTSHLAAQVNTQLTSKN